MNKQLYIIATLILLILVATFYWFEYRPQQIRKNCYNQAQRDSVSATYAEAVGKTEVEIKNQYYLNCVMSEGIK